MVQYENISICDYYSFCMDSIENLNSMEKDLELDLATEGVIGNAFDRVDRAAITTTKFTNSYILRFFDKIQQILNYLLDIIQKITLKVKLFLRKLFFKITSERIREFFQNVKSGPIAVAVYDKDGNQLSNHSYGDDKASKKMDDIKFINIEALNALYDHDKVLIDNAIDIAKKDPIEGYKELSHVKNIINPDEGPFSLRIVWRDVDEYVANKISMKDLRFTDIKNYFNVMYQFMKDDKLKPYLSKGEEIIQICKNNIKKIKAYPEDKIRELIEDPEIGADAGFYKFGHYRKDNSLISAQVREIRIHQIQLYHHLAREVTNGLMRSSAFMLKIMNHNTIALLKYMHYYKKVQN